MRSLTAEQGPAVIPERQPATPADDQLMAQALTDPQAFAELYDRYYRAILNYMFRCTLRASVAEDLTSSTFHKALQGLSRYQPTGSVKGWLYRIATNEMRMHLRSRRRHPEMSCDQSMCQRVTFDHQPDMLAEEKEQRLQDFRDVHRALGKLPDRYRSVLCLRYFEDLSNDEIAAVLGIRSGTAKSLISRGLAKLRVALQH